MNPARKRQIRLVTALTAAILLAGALMYTSFSAGNPTVQPSDLLAGHDPERTYKVAGKVAMGSVRREGETLRFEVQDYRGTATVPVSYTGAVPDPFREGREVTVTVNRGENGVWVGERDSLLTKCPSKFTAEES